MSEAKTATRHTRKTKAKPVEPRGWHVQVNVNGAWVLAYVPTDGGLTEAEAKRLANKLAHKAKAVPPPDKDES